MPSIAKLNIFFNGYFDSPANLSFLSYSTVELLNPNNGTIPLKNKFTSLKFFNSTIALLVINL